MRAKQDATREVARKRGGQATKLGPAANAFSYPKELLLNDACVLPEDAGDLQHQTF